jgi:hypothetical protein
VSGPRRDWDDARLEAAFAALAATRPSAPADLAGSLVSRLAADRRASRPGLWRIPAFVGVAVAVALAAAVGVGQIGRPEFPGLTATAGASTSLGPPLSSPSPRAALGEPISVSQALAVRALSAEDREITVAGFLSPWVALPCPMVLVPRNPTRLDCPDAFQFLMEQPEHLLTSDGASAAYGPPRGAAIQPSFALVARPDVPTGQPGGSDAAPVVLVGHFDDRRAVLCPSSSQAACSDVFVVDRVASVEGRPVGIETRMLNQHWDDATQKEITEQPIDLAEDVDRLVLGAVPGATILSRQLVTIDQVLGIEPILANDPVVPHFSPAALLWIVTALDSGGVPRARTFALIDGTNWFAEVTATGTVSRERSILGPQLPGSGPQAGSADPTAFVTAPTTVAGIDVRDIATVMRDRQANADDLGRDEFAIRGWYVGPNPSAVCTPALPPIHPPLPPCDEARHWLLDDPTRLGSEAGQVRRDPEHWPWALNPVLPVDVLFDVPATWTGADPNPQPVVVLGHFLDTRVETYAGDHYFVLDALAWTRDGPATGVDSVTRLTGAATEDPAAVRARIEAESGQPAVATWMTVVDAADFASLDPDTAVIAPEFTTGPPVWIVRRLIQNEWDGRRRLAVEWSFTADNGHRVWLAAPDSSSDLATTFDLPNLDARTDLVRVFDLDDQVLGVRSTAGLTLAWRSIQPREARMEAARGASTHEIAVRWTAGACVRAWDLRVEAAKDGGAIVTLHPQADRVACVGGDVHRSVVVEFDRPVDLNKVTTIWDPGLG